MLDFYLFVPFPFDCTLSIEHCLLKLAYSHFSTEIFTEICDCLSPLLNYAVNFTHFFKYQSNWVFLWFCNQ